MTHRRFIKLGDAPGDFIPCAPRNGVPAVYNPPHTGEIIRKTAPLAYLARFVDAVRMLRNGASREEVRAKHGGIVLRDAEVEVEVSRS
jgi:hypothetical protein